MAKMIKVPSVPASAFNKNRPASDLLRSQVAQLSHIVERKDATLSKRAKRVRTEGQAAAFIAEITKQLHPEGYRAPDQGTAAPNALTVVKPRRPKAAKRSGGARRKARPR